MNSYRLNIRRNFFLIVFIVITVGIIFLYRSGKHEFKYVSSRRSFDDMQEFEDYLASQNSADCFQNNMKYKIENLKQNIQQWQTSQDRSCKTTLDKFKKLYEVTVKEGNLYINPKFAKEVHRWMGYDFKLFEEVKRQKVIHVYDRLRFKLTAYNPLRAKRPVIRTQESPWYSIQKLINETQTNCDFCNANLMTATELFGRVHGKSTLSAANTFKIDKWHGLFIPEKHSIFDMKIEEFIDLFNTSLLWFNTVSSIDKSVHYPVLFWDMLPGAGASQVHVHVHGIFGERRYQGILDQQFHFSLQYFLTTGTNYWADLVEIHDRLGLAVKLGKAVAIAPLTSEKDHELLLITQFPNIDIYNLLYFVIQMYHSIGRYCYSSSMALPRIGYERRIKRQETLPTIFRIGTRGECPSIVNDVSSLELYTMFNINVDPYYTIQKLKETIKNMQKSTIVEPLVDPWH